MYLAQAFNSQPLHRGRNKPRKLTPTQTNDIGRRRYNGEKVRDLALEYGVTAAFIYNYVSPIEN